MRDKVIDQIEAVRRDNNKLWMDLLRIALDKAPDETKSVLGKINANDRKISGLLGLLAGEQLLQKGQCETAQNLKNR